MIVIMDMPLMVMVVVMMVCVLNLRSQIMDGIEVSRHSPHKPL
jgi:hypothetical protein